MPRPVLPVISDPRAAETLVALEQEQYMALPALRGSSPAYPMTSCWEFTEEEWEQIKQNGRKLWLTQLTFGARLQPIMVWHFEPTYDQCMNASEE